MDCNYCELPLLDYSRKINCLEALIYFLQNHGVLLNQVECPKCKNHPVCTFYQNEGMKFVCTNTYIKKQENKKIKLDCNYSISIIKDTIFEKSPYLLLKMCDLIALWIYNFEEKVIENDLEINWLMVQPFINKINDVCSEMLEQESEVIGGNSKSVNLFLVQPEGAINGSVLIIGMEALDGSDIRKLFIARDFVDENNKLINIFSHVLREWVNPDSSVIADETCYNILREIFSNEGLANELKLNFAHHMKTKKKFEQNYIKDMFIAKYPKPKQRLHYLYKALGKMYAPSL